MIGRAVFAIVLLEGEVPGAPVDGKLGSRVFASKCYLADDRPVRDCPGCSSSSSSRKRWFALQRVIFGSSRHGPAWAMSILSAFGRQQYNAQTNPVLTKNCPNLHAQ